MDTADIIALCISVLALATSLFSLYFSYFGAEAQLESDFQKQYEDIRKDIDRRYRDDSWLPPEDKAEIWVPFERYWDFCFQQYQATVKSPRGINKRLWHKKIQHRVASGLSHRPVRYVLFRMVKAGSLSTGYADEFLDELKRIHRSDFMSEFEATQST